MNMMRGRRNSFFKNSTNQKNSLIFKIDFFPKRDLKKLFIQVFFKILFWQKIAWEGRNS